MSQLEEWQGTKRYNSQEKHAIRDKSAQRLKKQLWMSGRDTRSMKRASVKNALRAYVRVKCPGNWNVSVWLCAHIDKHTSKAGGEQCISPVRKPAGTEQAGSVGKGYHPKAHRKSLQRHTQQGTTAVWNCLETWKKQSINWGKWDQYDHYWKWALMFWANVLPGLKTLLISLMVLI